MFPERHQFPGSAYPIGEEAYGLYLPRAIGPSIFETSQVLDTLIANVPDQGIFVELGSHMGATAGLIADAKPNTLILSVDCCWHAYGPIGWILNKRPNMRLYAGYSSEFFQLFNTKVNGIFIDADHSYEGVKADLNGAIKAIVPGAPILAHDYEMPGWDGVKTAVDEFCRQNNWRIAERHSTLVKLQPA